MADIDALLEALTLEEKASLTAGEDAFSTVAIERLGIPKIRLTDGPSGAKGLNFPGSGGSPSTCIPCGSAIGATWDPSIAERLGNLLGREALDRGCRGLLAPTVNLHRSPLAGRNFECYSEDPLLTGRIAAGYVRGVQSVGVFATVKHFVGNEAEHERYTINSVIDERALRELYLLPFEIAVREAGALGIMSAYNRVNGQWVNEQPRLLLDILRKEWGFTGLVMTDWFAVVDTNTALGAGLDLEMPGPARALGKHALDAINDGLVDKDDLDDAVRRYLTGLDHIGALDSPTPPINPVPPSAQDRADLRQAVAEGTVLLTNDGALPLKAESLRKVAVVGPRAADPCMVGGGSAQVAGWTSVNHVETLTAALGPQVELLYERGCEAEGTPTVVGTSVLQAPDGFVVEVFAGPDCTGELMETRPLEELTFIAIADFGIGPAGEWASMRVRGAVVAKEDGLFQLALAQCGRAKVYVGGELVLDGVTYPPGPGGTDLFGQASLDLLAETRLKRDVAAEVVVEFARTEPGFAGFRVGYRTADIDALLDRAVAAAAESDVALVYVGTNREWETEMFDRPSFQLPGRQDELVRRVAAVNDRTIVVVNAGAPVDLSWAEDVSAVLQCWFGGEEMAAGVTDVLLGSSEPGGRLPTTIPVRIEHSPSFDNFPGENGELRYGEGLFMGYRGYEHRAIEPRFPFGHGLSYTMFDWSEATLSAAAILPDGSVTVRVAVANNGLRAGSDVVQVYVAPSSPRLARPNKELKAFAKVRLEPGESTVVELLLEPRAFAYWDPGQPDWERVRRMADQAHSLSGMIGPDANAPRTPGWYVDPGRYDVLIGRSAGRIEAELTLDIQET